MDPEEKQNHLESAGAAAQAVWAKVIDWGEYLVLMLPNLAVAFLVLLLAFAVARVAGGLTRGSLRRAHVNDQLTGLGATLARIVVLLGGVFLALSVLELEKTVTSLLAGVGVVGLALGFAFQDIAANFMSGVLMAVNRPFEIGDWVRLSGFEGTVKDIDLRSTTVLQFSGELTVIPNKDVFQNPITNVTRNGVRRIDFAVGVNYGSDLPLVRQVALDAVRAHNTAVEKAPEVHITGFGGSSIDLSVRFWIPNDDALGGLERKTVAIMAVQQGFAKHGIDIPFPTRTITGWEALTEQVGTLAEAD